MKTFLFNSLMIIVMVSVLGLGLWGLSTLSTSVVVEIKNDRPANVVEVESGDAPVVYIPIPEELDRVVHKEETVVVAKVTDDIPSNVLVYLQDDVLKLRKGMSLEQVAEIWGKPDEVKRKNSGKNSDIYWSWGEFWEKDSKLKGYWHYKTANFSNGELAYWTREGKNINIKTHTRDDLLNGHLNTLKLGMSKLEVYKLWGIPASINIGVFCDDEIETDWHYDKNNGRSLSHYAEFVNNKLDRWGDF